MNICFNKTGNERMTVIVQDFMVFADYLLEISLLLTVIIFHAK